MRAGLARLPLRFLIRANWPNLFATYTVIYPYLRTPDDVTRNETFGVGKGYGPNVVPFTGWRPKIGSHPIRHGVISQMSELVKQACLMAWAFVSNS